MEAAESTSVQKLRSLHFSTSGGFEDVQQLQDMLGGELKEAAESTSVQKLRSLHSSASVGIWDTQPLVTLGNFAGRVRAYCRLSLHCLVKCSFS